MCHIHSNVGGPSYRCPPNSKAPSGSKHPDKCECDPNYILFREPENPRLFSCVLQDGCASDPCPRNSQCSADFADGGYYCSCDPRLGFRADENGTVPAAGCAARQPVDEAEIKFITDPPDAGPAKAGSETGLNFTFKIHYSMQNGDQITFDLPGFEGEEFLVQAFATDKYMRDAAIADLTQLMPAEKPAFESVGCFTDKDRATSKILIEERLRAQGLPSNDCSTQYSADRLVTSVDTCAFFTSIQETPRNTTKQYIQAFCIGEGNQCFFAPGDAGASFFETAAFADVKAPTCPAGGLGGVQIMECYKILQKDRNLLSDYESISLANAMQGQWIPNQERFVFTAAKEIELGTEMHFAFGRDSGLVRTPLWGLSQDSETITIKSSRDNREIPPHEKRMVNFLVSHAMMKSELTSYCLYSELKCCMCRLSSRSQRLSHLRP